MIYTVGSAAKKLQIAPSTIRYYDKEGLLPFVERSSGGIRIFRDKDFEWLRIIECLKKSGMPIKDIKVYIDMALKGDDTIDERLELFIKQRNIIQNQIKELQETLNILNYKCWFYETAKQAGTTDVPQNMSIDEIPENLRGAKESLNSLYQD